MNAGSTTESVRQLRQAIAELIAECNEKQSRIDRLEKLLGDRPLVKDSK